ncbi:MULTISPECIES: hypothetical protein [unclassified Marinovum]
MSRKLIAAVVAAAMAFTSLSAVPAAANHGHNRNLDRFVIGAGTLLLLNQLANNNGGFERGRGYEPERRYKKKSKKRGYAPLPGYCLTRVQSRDGPVRMYGQRCLNRNYRHADRLPQSCKVQVRTRDNGRRVTRVGYSPRCLRNRGFRVAGR